MAVKIRLKRFGTTRRAFWRIVVADARSPRDGRFIEQLGYYDPKVDPARVNVKKERAEHWLSVGAKPSTIVKQLFKREGILTNRRK